MGRILHSKWCETRRFVSPLLFVLVIETLIRAILDCGGIKGYCIPLNHKNVLQCHDGQLVSTKILGFADDLTLIGSRKDLKLSLEIVDLYRKASGVKLNLDKSTVCVVSSERISSEEPESKLLISLSTLEFLSRGMEWISLTGMIFATRW